jgi:opacity protein-like surface antigen
VSSFRGEPIESNLQTAWHVIAGVEYDLSDHIELQVEGYYKAFPQITNLNRNKLYDDTQANVNKPEILKKDFIIERGFATGVDVMVKADYRDFNFWAGYSLGLVRRDDGLTEYYPVFDRRHNLNLVGTWTFGKDRTWETSLRYNFGSGFPFTPRQGYGPGLDFTNPSGGTALDYDYTTSNGNLKTIYGELNSKRLPNYHRVDFTIKKVWIFTATSEFNVTAGATNLLNYENIFYVDANNVRYNQLPIMPTVSIGYRF